jgi:hypothetical protein
MRFLLTSSLGETLNGVTTAPLEPTKRHQVLSRMFILHGARVHSLD